MRVEAAERHEEDLPFAPVAPRASMSFATCSNAVRWTVRPVKSGAAAELAWRGSGSRSPDSLSACVPIRCRLHVDVEAIASRAAASRGEARGGGGAGCCSRRARGRSPAPRAAPSSRRWRTALPSSEVMTGKPDAAFSVATLSATRPPQPVSAAAAETGPAIAPAGPNASTGPRPAPARYCAWVVGASSVPTLATRRQPSCGRAAARSASCGCRPVRRGEFGRIGNRLACATLMPEAPAARRRTARSPRCRAGRRCCCRRCRRTGTRRPAPCSRLRIELLPRRSD